MDAVVDTPMGDSEISGADVDEARRRWDHFRRVELSGLPVYDAICAGVAGDDAMLAFTCLAPRGQRRPNLLLAAVHDLLLAGAEHPLARWYPTVASGRPPAESPYPAFRDFVDVHRTALAGSLLTRATQTNEPNRSVLWRAALADVGVRNGQTDVHLIELGASAGLNLLVDRYDYVVDDSPVGGNATASQPPGRAVMTTSARGRAAALLAAPLPTIAERIGVDAAPVDLTDPSARRWLRACIWAEQPDRLARLDAALAVALADPPTVVAGDAVDHVGRLVAAAPSGPHVVLLTSWVLTYLRRDRRRELEAAMERAARARGHVTWFVAEAPGVVDWMADDPWADRGADVAGEIPTLVGCRRWDRAGDAASPEIVARCHPHLAWLDWRAPPP